MSSCCISGSRRGDMVWGHAHSLFYFILFWSVERLGPIWACHNPSHCRGKNIVSLPKVQKQGVAWLIAVMRQISATFHLTHSYSLLHDRPRTKQRTTTVDTMDQQKQKNAVSVWKKTNLTNSDCFST